MTNREKIDRFYNDVKLLELRFPVAEISKATGYVKGNVSDYLSKKKEPSENFLEAFYKEFSKSLKNVPREVGTNNGKYAPHSDLQTILRDFTETGIRHEAAVNIIVISLAELIAKQTGKGIGAVSSELQRAISLESDRLLGERKRKP